MIAMCLVSVFLTSYQCAGFGVASQANPLARPHATVPYEPNVSKASEVMGAFRGLRELGNDQSKSPLVRWAAKLGIYSLAAILALAAVIWALRFLLLLIPRNYRTISHVATENGKTEDGSLSSQSQQQ